MKTEKKNSMISEQTLADRYAIASNTASRVADNEFDYEEGTPEHSEACRITDEWSAAEDMLREKIFSILRSESIKIPKRGYNRVLNIFMERNGYTNCGGWWTDERGKPPISKEENPWSSLSS